MKEKTIELIRKAGVVGAGGAGFPTHVKLDAQVDVVIVNGAECEPLVRVDQQLMVERAEELVQALELAVEITGADRGIIALKEKYKTVRKVLEPLVESRPGIEVVPLGDYYPAGDEQVLVYEAVGRIVPEGGIPLQVKAVVINVETLLNVARAQQGVGVTEKYVTIGGAVARPITVRVPLGVSVRNALSLAGGSLADDFLVIDGGPMMGKVVADLDRPITKTTKALLVFSREQPFLMDKERELRIILWQAQSACCQCQMCTDLCPRHLLGHGLAPHKLMRVASYRTTGDTSSLTQAHLCSECGVCDTYACPMGLSPRRVNQALKQELQQAGMKNPHRVQPEESHPWRRFRRVPTRRLLGRLGIRAYDLPAPLETVSWEPQRVELPLVQHLGAPSVPVVEVGDEVAKGQEVAVAPEGKLGANLHASIDGLVESVTDKIVIVKGRGKRGEGR